MLSLPSSVKILVAAEPVDMRKGIDGLSLLAEQHLGGDVYSGALFVFVSKRRDRLKILTWDTGGFVVYYKRLEAGRFTMPRVEPGDRFKLSATSAYSPDPIQVEIEVGPTLTAPPEQLELSIGELEVTTISVASSGSCDELVVAATRTLDVVLPQVLEPYRHLLLYETVVDGSPWRPSTSVCSRPLIGRSWRGAGTDQLATACFSGENLLIEGTVDVRVYAYFPGAAFPVWSTAAVETQLTCPPDLECMQYDYLNEVLIPCAENDGDVDRDVGLDDTGLTPDDSDAGCASVRSSPASALLLLLLGALLRRRRRAHRPGATAIFVAITAGPLGCGSDRAEPYLGSADSGGDSTRDVSHVDGDGLADSGHHQTDAEVSGDAGRTTDVRETSGNCDPGGDPLICQSEYFLRPEMAACRMTPTVKNYYECSECHSNEECPDGYICRAYSVCVEP